MRNPSDEFVQMICSLYGDRFDDREEDCAPGGDAWRPCQQARHKSLAVFQRELAEREIRLSTGKIRKILITGDCWSTEGSREAGVLYETLTADKKEGGEGLSPEAAKKRIAEEMGISRGMVAMLLPYDRVVYRVPGKTGNAVRCDRWRKKGRGGGSGGNPEAL